MMKDVQTIDEYLKHYPEETKAKIQDLRKLAHTLVPEAEEAIRYGMPTFRLKGKNLLHFAAYEHHIGFYPTPPIIEAFKAELAKYKTSKGAIQFPIEEKLPMTLIKKMMMKCVQLFPKTGTYGKNN